MTTFRIIGNMQMKIAKMGINYRILKYYLNTLLSNQSAINYYMQE